MGKNNNELDLKAGESIAFVGNAIFVNGYIPSNPFFQGRETGLDGKIFVTNERFCFKSKKHLLLRDLMKQEFSVDFKDIRKIEKENLFIFLPFFLVFTLVDGSKLKFSFGFSREKWFGVFSNHVK